MEGTVLHYDPASRSGIIRDDSGNRYTLVEQEWGVGVVPNPGSRVDFVADAGTARQIFAATG